MSQRPAVAVIVPCYNEEAAIAKVVSDLQCALPEAVVQRERRGGVGEPVEGAAEVRVGRGGHACAPISSASSGASTRSRPSAWRVVDFTVPTETPRARAVSTSVRSS